MGRKDYDYDDNPCADPERYVEDQKRYDGTDDAGARIMAGFY